MPALINEQSVRASRRTRVKFKLPLTRGRQGVRVNDEWRFYFELASKGPPVKAKDRRNYRRTLKEIKGLMHAKRNTRRVTGVIDLSPNSMSLALAMTPRYGRTTA